MRPRAFALLLLPVVVLLAHPAHAHAYGGPGSVISGIGAFLAVLVAILASVFGFLWFPLKKLFRRLRGPEAVPDDAAAMDTSEGTMP